MSIYCTWYKSAFGLFSHNSCDTVSAHPHKLLNVLCLTTHLPKILILTGILSIFNSAKCLYCVLHCNYGTICNMWTINQLVLIVLWMCLLAGATILSMFPLEFFCLDVLFFLFFFSWRTECFEGCAVWVVSVRHMGIRPYWESRGHILLASLGWLR